MGKGAILEGLTSEIISLMQQDTEGKIELIKHKTTYQPDDGVDEKISVAKGFNFEEYWNSLLKDGDENGT